MGTTRPRRRTPRAVPRPPGGLRHRAPFREAVLCATALTALAATAPAQDAPLHGFWVRGGVGTGIAAARCNVCRNDRDGGLTGYLGVGGTPLTRLHLGLEASGWKTTQENVDFALGALHGVAHWYPNPRGAPWFLSFGLGVVAYRADDDDPDAPAITARSAGAQLGIGYDMRVVPGIALTASFAFFASSDATLTAGGEPLTGASLTLLRFTLGLTFQ